MSIFGPKYTPVKYKSIKNKTINLSPESVEQRALDAKEAYGIKPKYFLAQELYMLPVKNVGDALNSKLAAQLAKNGDMTLGATYNRMLYLMREKHITEKMMEAQGSLTPEDVKELIAARKERIRKRRIRRKNRILKVARVGGMSEEEAAKAMTNARVNYNISSADFVRYQLYLLSDDELKEWSENSKDKKEKQFEKVRNATGWSDERISEHINHCREALHISFSYYMAWKCWELDDELLKTYTTAYDSVCLDAKYNGDTSPIVRKDLFNEVYKDFTKRRHWINRNSSFEEFKTFASGLKAIFCKPVDSSCGIGTERIDLLDRDLHEVYDYLMAKPQLLVEECIVQHHELAEFAPASVNTLRLVNLQTPDGEIHNISSFLRFGNGIHNIDNFSGGGMAAGVDIETGKLVTYAVEKSGEVHETHPFSHKPFIGYQVPHWDKILELTAAANRSNAECNYVGWDVAILEDDVMLVEGNSHSDLSVYQTTFAYNHIGRRSIVEPYL
jgi:hypothetical protein